MKSITVTTYAAGGLEIQDPFPSEGRLSVHIAPSTTKTFTTTTGQYNRIRSQLDAALAGGLLTTLLVNETEEERSDKFLELKKAADPTLRSGFGKFFVRTADGKPYFMMDTGAVLSLGMAGSDPLVFKGAIAAPADFPLPASNPLGVQNGWLYRVTANVTDSDGTKTNTGASFPAGSEIAWVTGTGWCELGDAPEIRGKVISVNGNRTDAYTADGTLARPYKTIAAAVAVAAAFDTIVVAPKTAGPYVENAVLPDGVSIEGLSGNYTYIDGNVTLGTSPCSIKYIAFSGATNVLTFQGGTTMRDVYSYGQLSLPVATAKVQAWNCHVNAVTKNAVVLADAAAEFYAVMGTYATTGDFATILGTNGKILLDHALVTGNRAAGAVVDSVAGTCRIESSAVLNAGAGLSIDATNGAGAADPNSIHNTLVRGVVDCGTAVTIIDSIQGAAITGTQITTPHVQHFDSRQVAPSDEDVRIIRATSAGRVVTATMDCGVAPAGAQELTFDVRIAHLAGGDHSALTAAVKMDNATVANTPIPLVIDPAVNSYVAGDIIYVSRSGYVAGGGPTLHDTVVDIELQRNI